MKKLLVLALVLSMATLANAALTLTNPSGDAISVDGDADIATYGTDIYVGVGIVGGTLAPLDNTALGAAKPDMAGFSGDIMDLGGVIALPSGISGGYWTMASSTATYPTGNYLTLAATHAGVATVTAFWYNEVSGLTGEIGSVTLIPEPMTLGLLAIGGLFLRRRK